MGQMAEAEAELRALRDELRAAVDKMTKWATAMPLPPVRELVYGAVQHMDAAIYNLDSGMEWDD